MRKKKPRRRQRRQSSASTIDPGDFAEGGAGGGEDAGRPRSKVKGRKTPAGAVFSDEKGERISLDDRVPFLCFFPQNVCKSTISFSCSLLMNLDLVFRADITLDAFANNACPRALVSRRSKAATMSHSDSKSVHGVPRGSTKTLSISPGRQVL